ncbi:MAG: hypothetical protein NTZ68_00500 [Candidatus Dependentiae bacterium]|nr:hypothetical protein [Candidatus Dependentiae bacterium]
MKRLLFFLMVSFSPVKTQESIFKVKQPKQNTSQLKNELGSGLQDLLQQCTKSVRKITELIDDIVLHAKELTGEQDGAFATSDKEQLKVHLKKVHDMQKLLVSIEKELQL